MEDKMISRLLSLICLALFLVVPLNSSAFLDNAPKVNTNPICGEGSEATGVAPDTSVSYDNPCNMPPWVGGNCLCKNGQPYDLNSVACQTAMRNYKNQPQNQ
jgi:hypothetical protein